MPVAIQACLIVGCSYSYSSGLGADCKYHDDEISRQSDASIVAQAREVDWLQEGADLQKGRPTLCKIPLKICVLLFQNHQQLSVFVHPIYRVMHMHGRKEKQGVSTMIA
jgi:hypothetical protein